MTPDEVLAVARAGAAAGCKEALFTLGDKPELRYRAARRELDELGQRSTVAYLRDMAERVLDETGLFPHLNPGVLTAGDLGALRPVSVSQGLMLESAQARLGEKGGPHYGSPDKRPAARLGDGPTGRDSRHSVHLGHPHRHRRDPARAHRIAAGAARSQRPPRPHPGDHRPELPGQAGHPDGRCPRARSGGLAVDGGGGADCIRAAHEPSGTAPISAPAGLAGWSPPASTIGAGSRR